ncbi:hypothetical protein AOL_s00091g14 [Orbilia oligospora ATCC 24927]|uniref:Uncharacterized protein n=1 Tax=Arthrobotrys oligospora (strain ATCC 24927 / CBS 115.81 / DSM 1491) TaxID=756982 RepID=G1XHW2_ARTOA|nr:hypothetical protein AOL_s00091g14 [Orbilia oligospora ATCC 24927]EGX47270.1 hypothetical protein AOL_s00091g14 [Orbilia oligospora ATCC 24927]
MASQLPTPPKTVLTRRLGRVLEREPTNEELVARITDLTRENGMLRKQIQEFHELWSSVQNLISQTTSGMEKISRALGDFDSAYEYAEANWIKFWDSGEALPREF